MKSVVRAAVTAGAALAFAAASLGAASATVDSVTYYTNQSSDINVGSLHENETDAYCNTGDAAVGGGGMLDWGTADDEPYMRVVQSTPVGSSSGGPSTGWRVTYHNEDADNTHGFSTFVLCAHVS